MVGDYNYYFDPNALLHGMTLANQWRVALLADEAHNLVERARGMYTASLDQRRLRALRRAVPAVLRRPLSLLERAWNGLHREQDAQYQPCESLPRQFVTVLQQTSAAITEVLSEGPPKPDPDLLRFYFDLLHFLRLAEAFGEHSLFDITRFDAIGSVGRRLDALSAQRRAGAVPQAAARDCRRKRAVLRDARDPASFIPTCSDCRRTRPGSRCLRPSIQAS